MGKDEGFKFRVVKGIDCDGELRAFPLLGGIIQIGGANVNKGHYQTLTEMKKKSDIDEKINSYPLNFSTV